MFHIPLLGDTGEVLKNGEALKNGEWLLPNPEMVPVRRRSIILLPDGISKGLIRRSSGADPLTPSVIFCAFFIISSPIT